MSTETASDVSLVQDEELLRKMWQETEDFGKKKEIRSHMYKIREARLKDFYGTDEDIATSSESRQHSATTTTKTSSSTTGTKVSDLMTHADNLADHSFLSLKSKEIRDSESPTKDSYKITETRKIDDRDWNVVESNEASRDGKTHTTSRVATTSGRQQLDDGELNYAAKSEQKASVFKDGDQKNFTKSVGASSQNVIKQEAFGGDENNKFRSSSTTTTSSSKFTTEKRSTTGDVIEDDSSIMKSSRPVSAHSEDSLVKITGLRPTSDSTVNTAETVVRKVYTEHIPNEFKNHPNYIDGKTKVTTETKTLPDGSTVTTTRYETKGATQYSTSSSSTTSSAKRVSSNEQTGSTLTRTAVTTEDIGRNKIDDNVTGNEPVELVRNQRVQSKSVVDTNDISRTVKNQLFENRSVNEDVKRIFTERDAINVRDYDAVVKSQDVSEPETQTVTRITKIIESTYDDKPIKDGNNTSTVTTVKSYVVPSEESQITTTIHKRVSSQYDKQRLASDGFLNTEREHVIETTKSEPVEQVPEAPTHFVEIEFTPNKDKKEEPKYRQPDRRQPIKPDKSELDVKLSPTEGQYETTYRSDYVPRRISVEVSPTHDAFARSLRSISPDRISKTGSIKSLRATSSTSLRSTDSPERYAGKPGRISPATLPRSSSPTKKPSKSPEKQINTETVKNKRHESPGKKLPETSRKPTDNYRLNVEITTNSGKLTSQLINADTITRRKKVTNVDTEIDRDTLTRKKEIIESTRSRSVSPTSTASDIEFIRHRTDVVTDLDTEEHKRFVDETKLNRKRTEDFDERTVTTVKKSQRISDKSATTPLINCPSKESSEIIDKNKPKTIRRTDTYEERCKEILGISDVKDVHRKPSLPNVTRGPSQSPTKSTKAIETSPVKPKDIPTHTPKSSPEKELPSKIRKSPEKPTPEKLKTTQQIPSAQESPSRVRKTPTKEPLEPSSGKHKDIKQTHTVQEFPSQIRKTPSREPIEPRPEKPKDTKQTPLERYSEKPKDTKPTSSIQEFPSQIRKTPTKEPIECPSEKPKDTKRTPSVQEFPSQIRKTPSKELLEPHPEKPKDAKQTPLERYSERTKDTKPTSSIQEFPSEIRKTPTKEPSELPSEKPKDTKRSPSVQEFPSQIRKTPTEDSLEPYSEKPKGTKPLKPYSEKPKDIKQTPSVEEFPCQIPKTPTKELIEPYSEKPKDTKRTSSIQEFPSQIRKTPTKEPVECPSEKPKDTKRTPSIQEFPSHIRKTMPDESVKSLPDKLRDTKGTPSVPEFPCQIQKTSTKEPSAPYHPEKPKDTKQRTPIQEFPCQIRKTPAKETLEPYPEKTKDTKPTSSVQEFPSQIRKSQVKEPLESYLEKPKDTKQIPSAEEFPSRIRKIPSKEFLEPYSGMPEDVKESPAQIRKTPTKEPLETDERKPKDAKQIHEVKSLPENQKFEPKPKVNKKPPSELDKQQTVTGPEKTKSSKQTPTDVKKSPERVSLDDIPAPDTVSLDDIPLVRKGEKGPENVVFNNVERKFDQSVDEFISNEKKDTEITLKTSNDSSIQLSLGIPNIQSDVKSSKKIKSKVVDKTKKERTTVVEENTSSTSEDEQDEILQLENQIIEDICDVVECVDKKVTEKEISETSERHRSKPEQREPKIEKKQSPLAKTPNRIIKSKQQKPLVPVDDFITVTKAQLLQSESKTPIEEPIQTKKFISTLCKEEEEENVVRSRVTKGKPNENISKPKSDRKTAPIGKSPTKKKQIELFLKKEKQDVNVKTKVDSKTTEIKSASKEPVKRIPEQKKISLITRTTDDKKMYMTEYTDEYCTTTKDKKIVKPASKVTARMTLTPTTKQTQIKKSIVAQETCIARDVEKVQKVPSKTRVEKRRPIPKKPEDQTVKPKPTETKQTATATKTTSQKTVEIQPARRHIVSTVINIKPKIKPESVTRTIHKTTVTRTITVPKTTPKDSKPKRIQNGHVSTDDDESDIEMIRQDEDVPIRETLKPVRDHITPSRKSPVTKPIASRKKCITTKSILIENAVADQREIIVDLKRSKSSREGTPDRICPYPVSSDVDLGVPRYPDRVVEPDDGTSYPKPTKISDIPLDETENVTDFNRITEVKEDGLKRTKTNVEEDTDECLLSVNEKVNKFLSTAEQVTKKSADMKPAPKVERPKLEVDDSLRQDECLLSVSDKVQRFISTAEQLAVGTRETFQRSRSPKYRDVSSRIDDDDHSKPKEKVAPSTFTSQPQAPEAVEKEQRPQLRKSISPEKREYSPRPASRDSRSPNQLEGGSPKYRTPERKSSELHTRKTTEEIIRIRKESFDDESTPKTSRRQSKDEPKTILSPTGRLRSTETIKKAKALFENIGKKEDTVRQRDILNKSIKTEISDEKARKDVRTRLTYDEARKSPSPDKPRAKVRPDDEVLTEEIPHYMTPLDRTLREHKMKETNTERDVESADSYPSRETSPDRETPHYMLPLDRTVRERSPHKENLKQLEDIMYRSTGTVHSEETDVRTTKFGVTLKRTDSGRMITSSSRKMSTSSVDQHATDLEIEENFDLDYLERLLETIVGYDIRRRIRAQIRIIKRAINENTLEVLINKRSSPPKERPKRPADKIESKRYLATDRKTHTEESLSQHSMHVTETSEYRSSYDKSTSSPAKSPSPSRERKAPSPKRPKDKSLTPDRKSSIVETDSAERTKVATTTTTRIFQTDLRKTKPASKIIVEEKPEWITQRPLKKVSDTSSSVKKIVTTTNKKVISSKEIEDVKPIDAITSGYGVGPTDENGVPLFGLKALRSQNKCEKTKVQGTVIRSHYYSEDGGEPEGEISITKFSTDPNDLEAKTVTQDSGIASVTTTQKFGYKGTPSLKTMTTKTKRTSEGDAEYRSTEKTSKVTRRGSVKEISQKFIENAVDTLKSERQSSYPKAGLILRTSSFKDAASNGTESSREGSPATQEVRQKIFKSAKTTRTTPDDKKAETFLTNKSKVTDVQDVISRMKSKETHAEETEEDTEARNLLNKFIGSQVLLSGMESSHGTKPISTKRTTKITTTTTSSESSKPTTVTRTFTHPITAELLETVWDEQTLKLLLEQSTDYEDRRIIRARLREVMAEQEACAELVEKASDEATIKESGSTVHGESLLLPLLQGLLDTPEKEQPAADSGTESGEDLRSGLILEVQSVLDKLSASLKNPSTNVSEEKRDSLLQLVNRLQAGLSCQLSPSSSSSERRSSLHQGRFSKRKQRPNRHTVGVTAEELEDARRLMEEIAFHETIAKPSVKDASTPLMKQNSEGSVLQTPPFKPLSKTKPVKNVTAKPFISSNATSQSQSGTSSTVDTPSETSGSLEFLLSSPEKSQTDVPARKEENNSQPAFQHSISLECYHQQTQFNKKRPLSEAISLDYSRDVDLLAVQKAVTQAAAIKQLSQMKSDVSEGAEVQDSETDDDVSTVKTTIKHEAEPQNPRQLQPQPDLIMQTNPIYNKPNELENVSDVDEYPSHLNEKANRFNNKKLRMKRANTIDIPKPLKYYECEEEDSENEEVNNRRNSYLALRGPIRVGRLKVEKKVPDFEPKTESDRKFVAFLDKHGENANNNTNKTSTWYSQQQNGNTNNWSSKFGNLKNNFEKVQANSSINSARNFWKSADDAVTAGRVSHIGPKISRQSARNLQQMFEEKQKQSQQNTTVLRAESNVVTGSLKVDTKSSKNIKVTTQPNAINKFSHAPLSAFKPVAKKIEPAFLKPKTLNVADTSRTCQAIDGKSDNETSESPLYLYSPKQFSPRTSSPVSFTPWNAGRTGESRVLSIAVSKFENGAREKSETNALPQRRMSSEKITIPQVLIHQQQNQPREKLSAPYLVKSVSQNNSVKKLSGQYDNMREAYKAFNSRERHDMKPRVFVPGENYTIQYNNPPLPKPEPRVYNAEYTITQQYYNIPRRNDDEFVREDKSDEKQLPSTEQVYDRAHIQNDQHPTHNEAQLHNQQQQLYNKTQLQQPCEQAAIDQSRSVIKPEVYDEPAKSNDEYQYTSSYQFRPQTREMPNPMFDRDRTDESVDFNVDSPKTRKHDYYGRFPTDLELDATKETKSPTIPNYAQQCYESDSSVKTASYCRQISQEIVKEYTPVSSKVMSGPVSQQAVTVQQNSPKNRDQHDMEFNLKATLQKFSSQMELKEQQRKSPNYYQKSPTPRRASLERKSSSKEDVAPPLIVYNNVKRPSLCVNDQPLSLESLEINDRGESVLSGKFHIPVKKTGSSPPTSRSELSKSESWHQICQNTQTTGRPSPRASPNTRTISRSKSSHTLAVPKQFEAGMTKSEMAEKRKAMEAYFGASKSQSKSETKKTSINRVKTSQKVSTQRQNSTGLCRSKTLPDIVCSDKLDDSNIDAIFEDLFNAMKKDETTIKKMWFTDGKRAQFFFCERKFFRVNLSNELAFDDASLMEMDRMATGTATGTHEGPVTATSQVTTRITTQQVKKPMSPFAKFRQLDKQNSLNSPPSTPKSPTGGGPLFKFTDPSLNQSANTVKQRLLQWCQMKTKEYENIQLDNFSTSWSDGMAFCALIHHFLPDAFDYKTLNPRNRRHNFTLAFQVADEKAGIAPLLDVDDMVAISRPDWKCVFTYVQSIYRRFKDEE